MIFSFLKACCPNSDPHSWVQCCIWQTPVLRAIYILLLRVRFDITCDIHVNNYPEPLIITVPLPAVIIQHFKGFIGWFSKPCRTARMSLQWFPV